MRIRFLKALNTWDGVYAEGSTHDCPPKRAKQWADEGIVTILPETPEVPATETQKQPAKAGTKTKTTSCKS